MLLLIHKCLKVSFRDDMNYEIFMFGMFNDLRYEGC